MEGIPRGLLLRGCRSSRRCNIAADNYSWEAASMATGRDGDSAWCSFTALVDSSGRRRWVVYNTCLFGCSWAAYGRSRVAAAFVRLSHHLIYHTRFGSMFVDDKLSVFAADEAAIMACLQVVLACALGIPLFWH